MKIGQGAANYVRWAVAWQLEDVSALNKRTHRGTPYFPNTATLSFGYVPQYTGRTATVPQSQEKNHKQFVANVISELFWGLTLQTPS